MTLLWLVATVGTWRGVRHELNEAFDSALEETAQRILPLAVLEISNRETPGEAQQVATLKMHKEYLSYLVRDAEGKVLMQSHDANPKVFSKHPIEGFSTTGKYRLYGASALRETVFIEVAEPLRHRRGAAREALFALLWPLLALIPISLLGTWLLVRMSLGSVLAYRHAVEARGVGDLSPIKVSRLPAEINPLADAVNRLLERLRKALEAERSFTANSAHELRTPLAATLAQVQRLYQEAPEGPLRLRAKKRSKAPCANWPGYRKSSCNWPRLKGADCSRKRPRTWSHCWLTWWMNGGTTAAGRSRCNFLPRPMCIRPSTRTPSASCCAI
nr:hypothetical protein GCM10020185_81280 [Pseudomonas brassicacearum subsp. brassicacearum]